MAKVPSKKLTKTASQREIQDMINNALTLARRPARLGEIAPERLRKLLPYVNAIMKPLMEHVQPSEEGWLEGEELVMCLLTCAMIAQTVCVMHSDTPPRTETATAIWGSKK